MPYSTPSTFERLLDTAIIASAAAVVIYLLCHL